MQTAGYDTNIATMPVFGITMTGILGCGAASVLSTDTQLCPRGIVVLTPWDSLLNEAKTELPLFPGKFFSA
jgi:hypothetical protein